MTAAENLDQACAAGPTMGRLTTRPDGRFSLFVQDTAGPGWVASFGPDARIVRSRAGGGSLEFTYRPYPLAGIGGHGVLEVTLRVIVDDEARAGRSAVTLTMDATPNYPLAELIGPVLRPRTAASSAGEWNFLVPDGEGLWLRGDGTGYGQRPRVTFHDHRITLPMTALVNDAGATLVVTAVEGHDHAVDVHTGRDEKLPGLGLVCLSAMGAWAYRREWRVVTQPAGGLAAVADAVTEQLRRGGLRLRTQTEKMREHGIPQRIRESIGGTVVWCHFDTLTASIVADLQAARLRSVLVLGRPADEHARAALLTSPYASGPYLQTYDVFPTGSVQELGWRGTYPPEGASDGWPDDLIRDMNGWLDPAWMYLPFPRGATFWEMEEHLAADGTVASRRRYVHDEVQVRSYRRCPSRHRAVVDSRGLPTLDALGASAVFYDIATAMWGLECYSPDHPCDRRQDAHYRRDALAALGAGDRLVFSEAGKWWAIDDVNGFEGLLSYDQELNEDCIQLTDYPEDRSRRTYEFDLGHRAPLFGMVARHAVTRTLWWGTGQDRHPATWPAKDALTALFGANPILVVDPDHPLAPGSERWRRFSRSAAAFDVLRDLARDARITSYETAGPSVGNTEFEGGITVEANVGFTSAGGLAPGEFVVRDAKGSTVAAVDPTS